MEEEEIRQIGEQAGQNTVKWFQRNKGRLMVGAIVILSLQNRSLRKDLAKQGLQYTKRIGELSAQNLELATANDMIKQTVLNIRLVSPMADKYDNLFDAYFGAKK